MAGTRIILLEPVKVVHGGLSIPAHNPLEPNVLKQTQRLSVEQLRAYVITGVPPNVSGAEWITQPTYTAEGSTVTFTNTPSAVWNGQTVTYPTGPAITGVPPTPAGTSRFDAITANEAGQYIRTEGQATQNPEFPQHDLNNLFVGYIQVFEGGINAYVIPAAGTIEIPEVNGLQQALADLQASIAAQQTSINGVITKNGEQDTAIGEARTAADKASTAAAQAGTLAQEAKDIAQQALNDGGGSGTPSGVSWLEVPAVSITAGLRINIANLPKAEWNGTVVIYDTGDLPFTVTPPAEGLIRFDVLDVGSSGFYYYNAGTAATNGAAMPGLLNNRLRAAYIVWNGGSGTVYYPQGEFVPIAANAYGNHPAFNTQNELNIWLLKTSMNNTL